MSDDLDNKDDSPPSFDDTRTVPVQEEIDGTPPVVPVATVKEPEAEPAFRNDEPSGFQKYLPWGAAAIAVLALAVTLVTGSGSGTVAPSKIEDGSITGQKIADGAIGLSNLDDEARDASVGATGPTGPAGKNAQGASSVLQAVQVTSASSNDLTKTVRASCPAGSFVSGGGAVTEGGEDVFVTFSGPVLNGQSKPVAWRAAAEELTESHKKWSVTVTALCLKNVNANPATSSTEPANQAKRQSRKPKETES